MIPIYPNPTPVMPPSDYLIKAYNPVSNQTQYFQTVSQFNSWADDACCGIGAGYINQGYYNGWNLTVKPW